MPALAALMDADPAGLVRAGLADPFPDRAAWHGDHAVRRADVVGILSDRNALVRLAGGVLVEQHDDWIEARRYLGLDLLTKVRLTDSDTDTAEKVASDTGPEGAQRLTNQGSHGTTARFGSRCPENRSQLRVAPCILTGASAPWVDTPAPYCPHCTTSGHRTMAAVTSATRSTMPISLHRAGLMQRRFSDQGGRADRLLAFRASLQRSERVQPLYSRRSGRAVTLLTEYSSTA